MDQAWRPLSRAPRGFSSSRLILFVAGGRGSRIVPALREEALRPAHGRGALPRHHPGPGLERHRRLHRPVLGRPRRVLRRRRLHHDDAARGEPDRAVVGGLGGDRARRWCSRSIIGSITFRLRGPYFVLASISVAEIIRLAALHFKDFTRGAGGFLLSDIPAAADRRDEIEFFTKRPFYYAGLGLAVVTILGELARAALEARLLLPGHPRGPGRGPLVRHQPGPLQEHRPGHLRGVHRLGGRLLRDVREVHRPEHRVRPRRLGADRPHLHHRRHRDDPRPGDRRDGARPALRDAAQPARASCRSGCSRPTPAFVRFIEATSRTRTCSSTASSSWS